MHRALRQVLHQRHHGGGIDAARQERAQGHVRHHLSPRGVDQQRLQRVDRSLGRGEGRRVRAAAPRGHLGTRPVGPALRIGRGERQGRDLTGAQLGDALIDRPVLAHVAVAQKLGDGVGVDPAGEAGMRGQGLQFRAEQENPVRPAALPAVIERLFPQPVAGQRQGAVLAIPQRDGEHPHRPFERRHDAPGVEPGQKRLGIGMAAPVGGAAGRRRVRIAGRRDCRSRRCRPSRSAPRPRSSADAPPRSDRRSRAGGGQAPPRHATSLHWPWESGPRCAIAPAIASSRAATASSEAPPGANRNPVRPHMRPTPLPTVPSRTVPPSSAPPPSRRTPPAPCRGRPGPSQGAGPDRRPDRRSRPPAHAASPGATRWPLTPSSTSSETPPTAVATTGRPAAIASISTTGTPSAKEGSTSASEAASVAATSACER